MDNRSLAPSLLAGGVLGLATTCFMATSSFGAASASPEPVETAAVVSQPVIMAPPPVVVAPVPEVRPAAAPAPAPAEVLPVVTDAARAETCQDELTSTIKENPIDFPRDRFKLTDKAKLAADKLLVVAKACSDLKIQIQAFTDNQGKKANNTRLSVRRAEAVKEYLVAQGLSEDLLTAVGFGPDKPVASNRSASGRAKNRRIEFRVTRVES
ncbi:MAG: OmpA family protein [Burkholderiales bacterium]|nr:MAG: OmpA family protein [Burkholderiales bacterium]